MSATGVAGLLGQHPAGRPHVPAAQADLGQGLLDHADVAGRRAGRAQVLERPDQLPGVHGPGLVAVPQRAQQGQGQGRADVGQPGGESAGAIGPVPGGVGLGQPGQPGEPVQAGVPGHRAEPGRVLDPVLDPDHVGAAGPELGDLGPGDLLAAHVEDHAQVGHGVGDGLVVVHPALGRLIGVDRLVNHDHLRPGLLGVPGRVDGGGDVVAHARQHVGVAAAAGLAVRAAYRLLGGLPGLGRGERVELAGVAVGGDHRDPGVHHPADQIGVGAPLDAAVRPHRRHGDHDHRGQRVLQPRGGRFVKCHRYSRGWESSWSETPECGRSAAGQRCPRPRPPRRPGSPRARLPPPAS